MTKFIFIFVQEDMMTLLGIFWPVLVLLPLALCSRYTHKAPTRQEVEEQKVRTELLEKWLNRSATPDCKIPEHEVSENEVEVGKVVQVKSAVILPDIEPDNEYRMNIAKDPTDTRWFIDTKHKLPEPSAAEQKIMAALEQYRVDWSREVSFYGLQFTTYSWPRFDFYLPRYRVIIEYDGQYSHNTPEQKKTDRSKEKFCRDNGIRVIRYNRKHFYHLHSHIDKLMEELHIKRNPVR